MKKESIFQAFSFSVNALLISSVLLILLGLGWEYSTRCYLSGFSNAVLPYSSSPEKKVEAILAWMEHGPAREAEFYGDDAEDRDPIDTLNYKELLNVCGTATNAFVNLASASGIDARRLLLLDPGSMTTYHVVAEVFFGRTMGDRGSNVPCDIDGQKRTVSHQAGIGPPRCFAGGNAEHRRLQSGLHLRAHRFYSFFAAAAHGTFSSNESEFGPSGVAGTHQLGNVGRAAVLRYSRCWNWAAVSRLLLARNDLLVWTEIFLIPDESLGANTARRRCIVFGSPLRQAGARDLATS